MMNILGRIARAAYKGISAILHLDFRIAMFASVLLLAQSGIAFAVNKEDLADTFGFYSFYCLIAAAILIVIQHTTRSEHKDKDTKNHRE
jgi:hypothetical protein